MAGPYRAPCPAGAPTCLGGRSTAGSGSPPQHRPSSFLQLLLRPTPASPRHAPLPPGHAHLGRSHWTAGRAGTWPLGLKRKSHHLTSSVLSARRETPVLIPANHAARTRRQILQLPTALNKKHFETFPGLQSKTGEAPPSSCWQSPAAPHLKGHRWSPRFLRAANLHAGVPSPVTSNLGFLKRSSSVAWKTRGLKNGKTWGLSFALKAIKCDTGHNCLFKLRFFHL